MRTNILKKCSTELHFPEVTSFKIGTLVINLALQWKFKKSVVKIEMLHQKLFQPNMWLLCKTARVKLHFCTCVFTKYVVFDQPSHHIRFGGNLSKTNCACMINFLYKIIHEPWLRGGAGKVEKILKGSLDSIPFDENSNYGWESLLEV